MTEAVPLVVAGRYRVLKALGTGGMGKVVLAQDQELGRQVALKTLARPNDLESLLRLKAEFRTLTDLKHPNLVRVHGLTEDLGSWYVSMEYVDGPDLWSYLAADSALYSPAIANDPTIEASLASPDIDLDMLDEAVWSTTPIAL
ncbi:MAG: serine/threonine protein kinase, partial [Myxococcota bacterium]